MLLQNISLAQVIVSLIVIYLTTVIYKNIIKPYRDYVFYKKVLTQNYKTIVNPFSILGTNYMKIKKQELAKYNDSYHFAKTMLIDYQVRLMKVGSTILIDLIDPQLIKEYYQKTKDRYYAKNYKMPILAAGKAVVGEGLLFSENDLWKKKKKILSHIFNFDFIHSKIQTIAQVSQKCYNQMQISNQNKGQQIISVEITGVLQKIFGNVVSKCFFGDIELEKIEGQQFFPYIATMFQLNVKRSLTSFAYLMGQNFHKLGLRAIDRQVNKKSQLYRKFAEKIIESFIKQSRQQKQQKKDVCLKSKGLIWWIINQGYLIHDQSKGSTEQKYNVKQLTAQITTFFLAGTQTTATVLTMLVYTLSTKPQILAKIKNEIKELIGDTDLTQITLEKIKSFHYLQNVLKESLRMFAPVPSLLAREVVKDHYLGKIPMKKGIQVSLKIVTNQYKPEYYQNPLQFNPDRWDTIDQSKAQKFSYFPFSSGHRVCIGQQLALLSAKIALIGLLRRYKEIKLQKLIFKRFQITSYGPQRMKVYLTKN